MPNKEKQRVEQKFLTLQKKSTGKDWRNAHFFFSKAQMLEEEDAAFAFRLLQRAKTLNPDNKDIKSLMSRIHSTLKEQESSFLSKESSQTTDTIIDQQQSPKVKAKVASIESQVESEELTFVDNTKKNEKPTGNKEPNVNMHKIKLPHFLVKLFDYVKKLSPFKLWVILPICIFAFYQTIWASPRYESTSQIVVKQPDSASSSPELSLLGGFGVSTGDNDDQLVKAFIHSADMLNFLEENHGLKAHYSDSSVDYFSRLNEQSSFEDFYEFYVNHVEVELVVESGILVIKTQGFRPEFAIALNQSIIEQAELFINKIGQQLATEQISFMTKEHENWTLQLEQAQQTMLVYQKKYKLLDPVAEGGALQSISFGLENQLATKRTELKALLALMSDEAPEVLIVKNQLAAIEAQLVNEKSRLSNATSTNIAMNEVISTYSALKVNYELAMQAYTASLATLEKTKIDAYKQIKFLITVQQATMPEDSKYPSAFYNITLFAIVISMLFGLTRIIWATIQELS